MMTTAAAQVTFFEFEKAPQKTRSAPLKPRRENQKSVPTFKIHIHFYASTPNFQTSTPQSTVTWF
jgi:hypothetical protein